jgi:hypothetical protein
VTFKLKEKDKKNETMCVKVQRNVFEMFVELKEN